MNISDSEPPSERHALPPGTRVQEFDILTVIGGGGFGIVYLAHDRSLQRRVALKEYLPPLAARNGGSTQVFVPSSRDSDTFGAGLRSFVNEARLLAKFEHPALVKVHRFWEENGTAYMVMPFYEGPTLQRAVADKRLPTDEGSLRRLLDPLMDALALLHRENCFHRDISPDNILLTAAGPVLLDFGAARLAIGEASQNFTVILKEGYAPVEQYATEEATAMRQGPWTDICALAGVIRFVITGKKPPSAVIRMAEVNDPMPPLATLLPPGAYSEPFVRALDCAMSIHVEKRPQTIEEFRALLSFLPSTLESETLVRRLPLLPAMTPASDPYAPEAPQAPRTAPQQGPATAPVPPPQAAPRSASSGPSSGPLYGPSSGPSPAPPPASPRLSALPDTTQFTAEIHSPRPARAPGTTARVAPPLPMPTQELGGKPGSLLPWAVALFLPLGLAAAAAGYHYFPERIPPQLRDWINRWVPQPMPVEPRGGVQVPEQQQQPQPPPDQPQAQQEPEAPAASAASAPSASDESQEAAAPSSSSESVEEPEVAPTVVANTPPDETKSSSKSTSSPGGGSSNSSSSSVAASLEPSQPVDKQPSVAVEAPRPQAWNSALLLMIKAARTDNWHAVEKQAAEIARVAKSQPGGNRVEAREHNKLGLEAVEAHNFPKAVSAFASAVQADPSDLEVANNYGYALALAGRKKEAQDILTNVLLRDPAREVAWTALVEARGEDSSESLAALKIALHFAASRERTLSHFRVMAQTHREAPVRAVVTRLLEQSDLVPTVPEGQH